MRFAMVGPYASDVKPAILERLPKGFELVEVSANEEYSKLEDVDFIVLRTLKLEAADIESLKKCRLIQRWGVGYDSVDIEAAGKRGIPVAITSGVNSPAVSELVICLILSVFRHVPVMDTMLRNGEWERQRFIDKSFMIKGKTVGLIGCGSIGKLVAKTVKAFGATVVYYDPFRMTESQEKELEITYLPFDELLKASDIVSLHMPSTDSTKGLINKDVFVKMKPTAILINAARGTVVNEIDLIEALKNKTIAGAGLDCFVNEPIEKDNPLLKMENLVLTPHVGGNTQDIGIEMVERVISNMKAIIEGKDLFPGDLVNAQFLKKGE